MTPEDVRLVVAFGGLPVSMAAAERWAAGLSGPAYAIDDETAIKVVDGTVEVVSEGHWKLFTCSAVATESGY
jgi:dipeptidase E